MEKFISLIQAIFLSIFLICGSIYLTVIAKPLYSFDVTYLKVDGYVYMDKSLVLNNYDILMKYLTDESVPKLDMPDFPSSKDGSAHFADVKKMFINIRKICLFSLSISILLLIISIYRRKYKFLLFSSILNLAFPILLSIPVIINFDATFIKFHELFFSNNYWAFDPLTDPIINALPEEFFMHCAFMIIILILFSSALCFCLYRKLNKIYLNKI